MKDVHSLRFDALEARMLLTRAHAAVAHAAPKVVATPTPTPVVLTGTLTVENKATAATDNGDGTTTVSVPVVGSLGTLGKMKGYWIENLDAFGDPTGLDSLNLHNAQGSISLEFNNMAPAKPKAIPRGPATYEHPQHVFAGTRAFKHATETGTIVLTTNNARTTVLTMTLATATT